MKLPCSLKGEVGVKKLQFHVYIGIICLAESQVRVKGGRLAGISNVCSIFLCIIFRALLTQGGQVLGILCVYVHSTRHKTLRILGLTFSL